MIKNFLIVSFFVVAASVSAQKTHTVTKGDTAYSIAKKYGMSLDELYQKNPNIKDGTISIGDELNIKGNAKANTNNTSTNSNSGKLGVIILKPKQTIYGITKQYKISEEDLRKLNPDLDNHMKIGDSVTLPLSNIQKYGDKDVATTSDNTQTTEIANTATESKNATSDNSYVVQEKDNYYKIGRKFNLTQKQLFALNPNLEEKGLHPGDTIIIKGNVAEDKSTKETVSQNTIISSNKNNASNDDYVTYTVQNGDTVFGILNKFGITLDQLLSLNPELSNGGLKTGSVLKIKKLDSIYEKKSGDALNVVLMLPFGFDTNDTKYRNLSADFLAGAKLAIERNTRNGLKMDVKIIDAGNESSFKNSLIQIKPENTDLIIGPFFKSNVVDVLDFVKNNKIPVVAPFANAEELYDYSNLIIVETNEKEYANRIIKEVKEAFADQKVYILADTDKSNANYLKSGLEKELKNANVVIVNNASEIQSDQNMMTGQSAPIIAILANDKDDVGNAFGNRMIELGKEGTGNKAFSMFYAPIFEKKTDDLSSVSLVYLMDRKINTDGSFEKEILADFKQKYCKSPSKYNVIGFDVVNDILSRENKKGEVLKNMGKSQTQLATKFEYERVKNNGAFVNKGYRVVRLIQ